MSKDLKAFIEGDISMEKIWEDCPGTASQETFSELLKLEKRMDKQEKRNSLRTWAIAACSAAAVLAVAVVSTFSVAKKQFNRQLPVYTQKVNACGDTASLRLPDGTLVAMNAGSSIIYPNSFEGDSRTVFFTGEGNFSIAKNPDKPFIVKTAWMDVEALGTRFCVQAYDNERTVRTTLEEGSVRISIPMLDNRSFVLSPDTQIVFTPADTSIALIHVNAQKVALWEQGYLVFNNASFQEIASKLERKYDISFVYDATKAAGRAFNVRLTPEETLSESLDVLTWLIPNSRYQLSGTKVFFYFP